MIRMYAITDKGNCYSSLVGFFNDIDDVMIRIEMFSRDVVLKLEYVTKEQLQKEFEENE